MNFDNPKQVFSEEIDIESAELKRLILPYNRTHKSWSEDDLSMHQIMSPFHDFVWSWEKYEEQCSPRHEDNEPIKDARADLRELMILIRNSATLEPFFKIRESQIASRSIKFEFLWTIFAPGTKVYARTFMNDFQMLEVVKYHLPEAPNPFNRTGTQMFTVFCSAFDWDGRKFQRYVYKFEIEKFDGERPIDFLEVFPIEYLKPPEDCEGGKLRVELKERGRRFWKLCKAKETDLQCTYCGTVTAETTGLARLTANRDEDDNSSSGNTSVDFSDPLGMPATKSVVDVNGKIIVDNFTFLRSDRNPGRQSDPPLGPRSAVRFLDMPDTGCQCYACNNSVIQGWKRRSKKFHNRYELVDEFVKDEERLLFCPPKILGYALQEKLWAQFRIKDVKELDRKADTAEKGFFNKELQLDQKYKDLLLGFVNNYESVVKLQDGDEEPRSTTSFDPIDGKGAGLAILLHGPPGVGKTLTAETIALATGRPLLTVSVAEIGVEAYNAETKLASIFADAQRWRAVLLIDEADVFLEERIKTDNPNRNALVSVLLKCLEYYQGLIILTTNRIRSIDVAVQSRMHLAIQYKALTQVQKEAIFEKLLSKIPDREIDDRRRLYRDIKRMCRDGSGTALNGRQIRNIVASAHALARHDNTKLTFDHLDRVYEMTSQFLESLRDQAVAARGRNEAGYVE